MASPSALLPGCLPRPAHAPPDSLSRPRGGHAGAADGPVLPARASPYSGFQVEAVDPDVILTSSQERPSGPAPGGMDLVPSI